MLSKVEMRVRVPAASGRDLNPSENVQEGKRIEARRVKRRRTGTSEHEESGIRASTPRRNRSEQPEKQILISLRSQVAQILSERRAFLRLKFLCPFLFSRGPSHVFGIIYLTVIFPSFKSSQSSAPPVYCTFPSATTSATSLSSAPCPLW